MTIRLTEEERSGRRLGAGRAVFAAALLNATGAVVIENAFLAEEADALRARVAALEAERRPQRNVPGSANIRFNLPVDAEWMSADLVLNPLVLQLADELVGADCILRTFAAETLVPGGAADPELRVPTPLFPETEHARFPAHNLLVDIALDDIAPDSGALTIWPGSHQNPDHLTVRYDAELMRQLANATHAEPLVARKGSLIVRDSRVWHRETANASPRSCTKLTLSYRRWWDIRDNRLDVPLAFFDAAPDRLKRLLRFERIAGEAVAAR